ncbi:hypothetical protein [Sphingomonas sp.]|jgi:hypothetical protein|uniref:hypothetical protein n=1 Tax=Sphingomonas sp. TaxID=28214 RepID=UPI002EDB898B
MTEDIAYPRDGGCLPLLVSTALVALVLTTALTFPYLSIALYIAVLMVTAFIVAIVGLPLYLLVLRLRWQNLGTALATGALTGVAIPVIFSLADRTPAEWPIIGGLGAAGVIGGAAFFLVATASQNRARNLAILMALGATSVAFAPVVAALLSLASSSAAR